MDYEKKYKKALERANEYHFDGAKQCIIDTLEYIFPELKESEDERTRKDIKRAISVALDYSYFDKETANNCLAWLEKQGVQKLPVEIKTPEESLNIDSKTYNEIVNDCIFGEDKPKFKVGDSIKTTNEEPLTITKIDDKGYWSENLFICGFGNAAKWELVEQKSVWSEEDEERLKSCLNILQAKGLMGVTDTINSKWLKSLKQRVQPKPEWSEEDEMIALSIEQVMNCASLLNIVPEKIDKIRTWLKSLKERL